MSERDTGWAADDEAVTAQEQRRGRALDERLDEEASDRDASSTSDSLAGALVDEDRPDTESELVSELAPARDREDVPDETTETAVEDAGWDAALDEEPAAEELAVDVRDEAPGGTEDATDGYVDRERGGPA